MFLSCCDSRGRLTWLSHSGAAPACLKQTDCLGTLTPSAAVGGASLLLTPSQVMVRLASLFSVFHHNTVALEANLGHVFSFLNRVQSDHGMLFIAAQTVTVFDDLLCSLPSIGMVLSGQSSQLHLLHLLLVHTPEEGSVVVGCSCPPKAIVYPGPPPGWMRGVGRERRGLYRPTLKI